MSNERQTTSYHERQSHVRGRAQVTNHVTLLQSQANCAHADKEVEGLHQGIAAWLKRRCKSAAQMEDILGHSNHQYNAQPTSNRSSSHVRPTLTSFILLTF